jgi:hypothetical protein
MFYSEEVKLAKERIGIVVILEHVASRAEGDETCQGKERRCKHFQTSDCNERLLQKQRNVLV